MHPAPAAVSSPGERITALDTVRGVALLGILLMNIVLFASHHSAYDNPAALGEDSGLNLWVWYILHIVAEGKMRCLFSLVFGASVILLTSRLEGRPDAADLYYRRTLWLLVFGIAHGYLLWHGEILYPYALCGLALYPFRNCRPRTLAIFGGVLMAYGAAAYGIQGHLTATTIAEGRAALAREAAGETLSYDEDVARSAYQSLLEERRPTPETLEADAARWRGNPIEVIKARTEVLYGWVAIPYYHWWNTDGFSMMLLGMALLKTGVLAGTRSPRFYVLLTLAAYGLGIPLHAWNGWVILQSGFDAATQQYAGIVYDVGRLAVAAGHLGLVMLVCRLGWFRSFTDRLGAVGQMALTNYVMQSVICAFLFTGYGFGLYGRLERYQLYYVVAAIWILQLWISPRWLRHHRFGPLEWVWRSLTQWQRQPLRRVVPA